MPQRSNQKNVTTLIDKKREEGPQVQTGGYVQAPAKKQESGKSRAMLTLTLAGSIFSTYYFLARVLKNPLESHRIRDE